MPPQGEGTEITGSEVSQDLDILNDEIDDSGDHEESEEHEETDDRSPSNREEHEEEDEEADKEEEEEEEKEEEEEDKSEEKEEEEEQEEEEIPPVHARPTLKQIQEKYPNLFKDFPDLRHAFFREREYSTMFPTVEDAKEAADKADSFDQLETLVMSGKVDDFQSFMSSAEQSKSGAIRSMASVFLPSLYRLDQNLYYNVTSPLVESVLRSAYKAGKDNKNNDLLNAALHISKHVFGDVGYATGDKATQPVKVEQHSDPKFDQEKREFYQQRFNEAKSDVATRVDRAIRRDILKGLDPNKALTEFVRDTLVDKIQDEVGSVLQADQRHMRTMNALWRRAHQAGFAGNWKERILATYLSRARAVMPQIRQRLRAAALKGTERNQGPRKEEEVRRGKSTTERRPNAERPAPSNGGKQIDWSRTSDKDYLDGKITYKR